MTDELFERLDELEVRISPSTVLAALGERGSATVTLGHSSGRGEFLAVSPPSMTMTAIQGHRTSREAELPLLVLGERVTERSAEMFRTLGINYLDRAGNAFLRFGGVHIDVRGRRSSTSSSETRRTAHEAVNLFSRKRAQVIFAILVWPETLSAPIRVLARTAGVSVGQAQATLGLLRTYRYLDEKRQLSEDRRRALLRHWVAAYPTGLGAAQPEGEFAGDITDLRVRDETILISGEAAVPKLIRPESLILYVEKAPTALIRERRWRRDESPNVFLRRKFWHAPDEPGIPAASTVPTLLTYADLLASGESRQKGVAEQLRREDDRLQ